MIGTQLDNVDDLDTLRDIVKPFDIVIQYKGRFYNVFRLINHRPIFQARKYTFKELVKYIRSLTTTTDYENSKCVG